MVPDRIFEPVETMVVEGVAHFEGATEIVAAVGIEHQRDVAADGFAYRADHGHHLAGLECARVDLVGVESPGQGLLRLRNEALGVEGRRIGCVGGDLVALGAEQLVHRQPRRLAGDVPERHVNRRPGRFTQTEAGGEKLQAVPQPLALERLATHQLGFDDIEYRPEMRLGRDPGTDKAVAFQSRIGEHT